MNRYPLNSRVLGAGTSSPLSYVAAFQVFYFYVAATAQIYRGMRSSQTFTMRQTSRAVITRLMEAFGTLALNLSLTTRVRFQKYLDATQALALIATATARQRIRKYVQMSQAMVLNHTFTIHHLVKQYAASVQNFAMRTTARYSRVVDLIYNQVIRLTATTRLTHQQSFKAAQSLYVNGLVKARTALSVAIDQALDLVVKITTKHYVFNPVVLQRSLALMGSLTAYDVTTTPANAERTATLAKDLRLVIVPGESYVSGV